ncbi:hypothetical protein [Olsenella profusa]|uniref:Putative lipoprotein n=1 Tax=Olsenella profusa F0195 TaxID=1125712 RepID=U2T9T6_9ACTN|nr:hypothetical protein [Olsenella profusa]ERL09774.1 putative lipoprotein [Olsenella profusa F0195]
MLKNKVVSAGLGIAMALSLGACGGQPQQQPQGTDGSQQSQQEQPQAKEESAKKDFDGSGQSKVGEGTAMLHTQAGTTEGGNVPKLTVPKGTTVYQIELDTKGLDGSAVTHVYVDGMEATEGNFGDSQLTFDLKGDALKEGTHTVEVVQFQGDEVGGTVTLYRSMGYEIAS